MAPCAPRALVPRRTQGLPLLLLFVAACKTTPLPAPASPEASIVALALRTDPDREAHAGRPRQAYFVKLSDDADATRQPVLLRSDFTDDGVMVLLNAAPGRYAAVACYGKGEGREWTAYLPETLIRATEKQVPAGKAVLLGSFVMDLRSISTTGDAAQHHYLRVLWPGWEAKSAAAKMFLRDNHAWGGPWRDAGDAKDALARMKESLGPEWASRFE